MLRVFYHRADLDGHCSGAIAKYVFPEAQLCGLDYGDAFPWESIHLDDTVIMLDFSLQPFSEMNRLAESCRLFWIDHHRSAVQDAEQVYGWLPNEGEIDGRRIRSDWDTQWAACELAWKVLTDWPDRPIPLAVHWLGRYDIWDHHQRAGCLEFQYGMRLYNTWPHNEAFWRELFENDARAEEISQEGALCLRYETEQNRKFAAAYAFEAELDDLRCIAVNKGMTNSRVFDSVYDPARHDAMLSFAWRNGQWTISLYSTKPEVDVSAICKGRGGGGHKGAAGFQCKSILAIAPAFVPSDRTRETPEGMDRT